MNTESSQSKSPVIARHNRNLAGIYLNRPAMLNSLSLEMIRLLEIELDKAEHSDRVRMILLSGKGERGFCAGGDIKVIVEAVKDKNTGQAARFFEEEYALDLRLTRFPKPVVVLADGITMGGGLGLAAGADIVIATERTRMAMPETRIGFFPDVGATGWLFDKCPEGYPEFLGLTGYEAQGAECVRVGLASILIPYKKLPRAVRIVEEHAGELPPDKTASVEQLHFLLKPFTSDRIPEKPEMDAWVKDYFAGKTSIQDTFHSLSLCSVETELCNGVFRRVSERSPTALALTLMLLRRNEGRPPEEVFQADLKAAMYMVKHPDFIEGVRARLIDKDDNPKWRPGRLEQVGRLELEL